MYALRSSTTSARTGHSTSSWLGGCSLGRVALIQQHQQQQQKNHLPRRSSIATTSDASSGGASRWKYLLFSDLHVSGRSLDRCMHVLKRVRELYKEHECDRVVFLGDFFHHRNVLNVKSVDSLLKEFKEWEEAKVKSIFIPGNHDQVDREGMIHAVSLFSPFPSFLVSTVPHIDKNHRTAFLPWRESHHVQSDLFTKLPAAATQAINNSKSNNPLISLEKYHQTEPSNEKTAPWTIFAHAEVGGAYTNNGYETKGKITVGQINKVARACYLGHFHKRQKLGDRIWYIGDPYEQNFGEARDPKGVALVTSSSIEPQFINFDDTPKHWTFNYEDFYPKPSEQLKKVRPNDYVRIYATHNELISPTFAQATACSNAYLFPVVKSLINQQDETKNEINTKQPLVQSKAEISPTEHLSLSLEDIIERYVYRELTREQEDLYAQKLQQREKQNKGKDKTAAVADSEAITIGEIDKSWAEDLIKEGRHLLSLVPDQQRNIVPLGKKTQIKQLSVSGFCGIKDSITLDLEFSREESMHSDKEKEATMVLLRGPMGAGKSSLFDALSWCLYGRTTPRRGGTEGASLRSDEVVNDNGDMTSVTVLVELDGQEISITRSKKRSKSPKLEVTWKGENSPLETSLIAIKDQQEIVNKVIGVDFNLWRACVFLGQGEVTNFVSDTDKKRKDFLSMVFSLMATTHAQNLAKDQSKKSYEQLHKLQQEIAASTASYKAHENMNYEDDLTKWEASHTKRLEDTKAQLQSLQSQIAQLESESQVSVI
eukprot:TRINITY_DN3103_c0_g1_i2.p1 TRINITY_DN3103_c0_g1~~TRINITY_DN3103_c0_g1_i2.p1  ORF type:complete len:769 (+),score=143.18 TRINITY_DN3103_c0_g1_i2:84-2390(+)